MFSRWENCSRSPHRDFKRDPLIITVLLKRISSSPAIPRELSYPYTVTTRGRKSHCSLTLLTILQEIISLLMRCSFQKPQLCNLYMKEIKFSTGAVALSKDFSSSPHCPCLEGATTSRAKSSLSV